MDVLKPFKTTQRRFAPGQAVSEEDLRGHAPVEAWLDGGFVSEEGMRGSPTVDVVEGVPLSEVSAEPPA